jgi:hypothetical protein
LPHKAGESRSRFPITRNSSENFNHSHLFPLNENQLLLPRAARVQYPNCRSGIWEPLVLSGGKTSTTMKTEPGVVDANVLVYAMDADAQQHKHLGFCSKSLEVRPPLYTSLLRYFVSFIRSSLIRAGFLFLGPLTRQ